MSNNKKIFLDCGTHFGEGLKEFHDKLNLNGWLVYAFEPNPSCIKKISLPFKIEIIEKAVWIENGEALFRQDNNNNDKCGVASNLAIINNKRDTYIEPIYVKTLDFSEFVHNLPENTYIVCKMDIEGAEFEVLNKMIKDKSICRINELYCELHGMSILYNTKDELIKKIKKAGVKFNLWK